jgi:hypothetical protein
VVQQDGVQPDPDSGFLPLCQPAAATTTGAAVQLRKQVVPVEAGLEDEEDAGQRLAVGQGLAAGVAEAARLDRGQERLDALPQVVGQ